MSRCQTDSFSLWIRSWTCHGVATSRLVIGVSCRALSGAIWHLEQRREILESYLDRRAEEGLPMPDRNEFLYLEDALHALECVDWIGRYCRDILGGEQVLRGLDGGKLDDYAGDEAENLEAARRALECHEELSEVLDVLDKYFGLPLATQ